VPVVCIRRPNRSKPRRWTVKDVARIARAARIEGATEAELVAAVMESSEERPELCEWIDAVIELLVILRTAISILSAPGIEEAMISAERWIRSAPIPATVKVIVFGGIELVRRIAAIAAKLQRAVSRIDDLIALFSSLCGGTVNANT